MKKKKKPSIGRVLSVLFAIAAAAALLLGVWMVIGTFRSSDRPHRELDPEKPMVALSFDDGPNEEWTQAILKCLEQNGVVATFFETGANIDRYPDLVAREEKLGCEVGSHTYDHIDLTASDRKTIEKDSRLCEKAFRKALGHAPTLLRPPYGNVSGEVKQLLDIPLIGWSLDTEDWRTRETEAIVASVQNFGDLDGQVILMHSLYESSAKATEILVPWLLEQGYQLVTVSELLQYRYGTAPQPHVYYTVDFFRYGKDPES